MGNLIEIKNKKFGRLTAIKFAKIIDDRHWWLCKCDCGKIITVRKRALISGHTQSCGCYRFEQMMKKNTKHGQCYGTTYCSWSQMRSRCSNPRSKGFKNYGGRGIKVCNRWQKFGNFFKDMGQRPRGFTLERINNSKDYTPKNCKWATYKEQNRNNRRNHLITFKGKTQSISAWSEETGVNPNTLQYRIRTNWPLEKALKY